MTLPDFALGGPSPTTIQTYAVNHVNGLLCHDNGRAGLSITGSIDSLWVSDSCFLYNPGGGVSIDDESGDNFFQMSNLNFARCVFAYSGTNGFNFNVRGLLAGVDTVNLDACVFYRNFCHLFVYPIGGEKGKLSNFKVTCCHFIESISTAIIIQPNVSFINATLENCTFRDNWKRYFAHSAGDCKLDVRPALDAPFYVAEERSRASEILFSRELWVVKNCYIKMSDRDEFAPFDDDNLNVPCIFIPLDATSADISGILLDRSGVGVKENPQVKLVESFADPTGVKNCQEVPDYEGDYQLYFPPAPHVGQGFRGGPVAKPDC